MGETKCEKHFVEKRFGKKEKMNRIGNDNKDEKAFAFPWVSPFGASGDRVFCAFGWLNAKAIRMRVARRTKSAEEEKEKNLTETHSNTHIHKVRRVLKCDYSRRKIMLFDRKNYGCRCASAQAHTHMG